jgi:hypothetical protein
MLQHTAVICCVSPAAAACDETASTLLFGDRARRVLLRLRPNEVNNYSVTYSIKVLALLQLTVACATDLPIVATYVHDSTRMGTQLAGAY